MVHCLLLLCSQLTIFKPGVLLKNKRNLLKHGIVVVLTLSITTILLIQPNYLFSCKNKNANVNVSKIDDVAEENILNKSKYLNDTWITLYGLNLTSAKNIFFENSSELSSVPAAPHLQNCPELLNEITKLEHFDSKIGYPKWSLDKNVNGVKPPWVKGNDEDNLPLTRLMQRNLWVHQHPLDCASPLTKFLVSEWFPSLGHGLGSQLHIMAYVFSIAYASNRVFVPMPTSFEHAKNENCKGEDHGSLNCYFFPLVSSSCEKAAMDFYKKKRYKTIPHHNRHVLQQILKSKIPLLVLSSHSWNMFYLFKPFPYGPNWLKYRVVDEFQVVKTKKTFKSQPWSNLVRIMEVEDKNFDNELTPLLKFRIWLTSQIVRYMLRWPSLHLCHVLNQERHKTYGKHVIHAIINANLSFELDQNKFDFSKKFKKSRTWTDSDQTEFIISEFSQTVWNEPYIPRPIVSVHVRQGDKAKEMKLFSLTDHMYFAQKLKFLVPNLKYVWLSTEMENIIEESESFPSWKFYYSRILRQRGNMSMHEYTQTVGSSRMIDSSFANLLIASECNYFVGTLGSNWNALINELRLTNGRVKSNYLSLNFRV